MREHRFLVSLMILAMTSVDLAALAHAGPPDPLLRPWPTPNLVVVLSLAFSQVSLIGVWAGLGAAWVPWRVAGVALVVTFWSIGLTTSVGASIPGYDKNVWTVHLASQAALILAAALLLRWRGRRLVNRSGMTDTEDNEEDAVRRPRFQFSISYLVAWMTSIAITLGMFQYTVDFASLPSAQFDWEGILACNLIAAVTLLATLLLTLDSRPRAQRNGGLGFVSLLGVILLALLAGMGPGSQDSKLTFAALLLLQVAWLTAAFVVLRVAGLRVTTRQTKR